MFGVEDLFKFVNDPTDAGNGFFRNILTSFAPRDLKDIKTDIGYGLNKTGIMSDKEFEGLKSKKMLSSRFDDDGWWKNFRVELNKHTTLYNVLTSLNKKAIRSNRIYEVYLNVCSSGDSIIKNTPNIKQSNLNFLNRQRKVTIAYDNT